MAKKIKDITFDEFSEWCNRRACDGQWSMQTAMICIEVYDKIYAIKSIFRKKKKREDEWNKIKADYFNLDAEIEV